MHPYSLDLRQKVIAAYENHEGSQRQLASRFKVSLGFIQNIKLEQNLGVQVSISTLHYFLQKLKLTQKKNFSRRSS
ncbi:hypothetical protein MC7420_6016 [Coleofasciculus chthonoplastes PCC 7420]|uniref:Transposase Synechocystis PCC 6803 domain-containing protein n=1 Tax=Coleofasciculus chthonoplastes PCC 7420 TaxID=118168 RepID=B4VTM3_9CYAN|nr:hypothetical protein MC7420_6016 [Coleofasciculus chthonoplastes PCC 7420]